MLTYMEVLLCLFSQVWPRTGPLAGGTKLTISGLFTGQSRKDSIDRLTVQIGYTDCTSVQLINSNSLTSRCV